MLEPNDIVPYIDSQDSNRLRVVSLGVSSCQIG